MQSYRAASGSVAEDLFIDLFSERPQKILCNRQTMTV